MKIQSGRCRALFVSEGTEESCLLIQPPVEVEHVEQRIAIGITAREGWQIEDCLDEPRDRRVIADDMRSGPPREGDARLG